MRPLELKRAMCDGSKFNEQCARSTLRVPSRFSPFGRFRARGYDEFEVNDYSSIVLGPNMALVWYMLKVADARGDFAREFDSCGASRAEQPWNYHNL